MEYYCKRVIQPGAIKERLDVQKDLVPETVCLDGPSGFNERHDSVKIILLAA